MLPEVAATYRMTERKCSEDVRKELGITGIGVVTRNYQQRQNICKEYVCTDI